MTVPIRVLVVDDSAFMRTAVARTLSSDERIVVVGQARDGKAGVEAAARLRPDVVTMDFNMPRMNGAEAVRAILAERPVPVVMLSAHTTAGAKETVAALSAGAVDFVTKPSGEVSTDLVIIHDELVRKVIAATRTHPRSVRPPPPAASARAVAASSRSSSVPEAAPRRDRVSFASALLDPLVVVGISTGGPAALAQIVPRLPSDLGVALLIVQHMPARLTAALAQRLDAVSPVAVREARGSEQAVAGVVLLAPGDRHVVVQRSGLVALTEGPLVNGCRPSADVTMQSAAQVYGHRMTALVMTGTGRDGTLGAAAVRAAGGRVLAQDRESCVVYGMPRAVADMGVVDEVVPLDRIAERIAQLGAG